MNEYYCWTHRYQRQGSHAPPSLTNLVQVKHATRSVSDAPTSAKETATEPATVTDARVLLLTGYNTVPAS